MPTYSHVLDEERDQIAVMRAAGRSICAIARALQRAKSTVSRELRRNGLSSGRYSPLHAAGAYQLRRRREAILEKDRKLRTFVCDRLAEGWTPEQISGCSRIHARRGALGFVLVVALLQLITGFNGVFVRFTEKMSGSRSSSALSMRTATNLAAQF
jgi:IS30 family transposase